MPIHCSLCRDWRQLFQNRPLTFRWLKSVKMKPIHPWTGEAHIPVFSASLFVFALKWTPINLRVSRGWELVCESAFYLYHLSALIYQLPAQPRSLVVTMWVGMLPGVPGLFSRHGPQPPSCIDTAFGISLKKGQQRLYIPGMALLPYKNISNGTYFLGFSLLGDYSLWFFHSWKRGEK